MKKTINLIILIFIIGPSLLMAECQIGVFVPSSINGQYISLSDVDSYEAMVGKKAGILNFFIDWVNFPALDCARAYQNGSIPMITWQPETGMGTNTLQNIIDGGQDSDIVNFAQSAKAFGKDIFLRFAHEMNNGDAYDWTGYKNGANNTNYGNPKLYDGPERYVLAFQHVHNIFKQVGANNVKWIWCPDVVTYPTDAWNNAVNYYPGDAYVDWIGMDGYNTGNPWKDFDTLYSSLYNSLISLATKPIMICEFSYSHYEVNGSITNYVDSKKATWITDTFNKIKNNYTRIKAFCWFNENKTELNAYERDWRINSGPLSLNAYRQAISDPYFWEFGSVDVYSDNVTDTHHENLDINIGPNYLKMNEYGKLNIFYRVKKESTLSIKIYNANGKFIRNILDNKTVSGNEIFFNTLWDGKDDKGIDVKSGLYFIDIHEGKTYKKIEKVLLIR